MKKNFIDYVKIYCKSGDGGVGLTHFYRGKFIPQGAADGGDGGKGGDVVFRGNKQISNLLHLQYVRHLKAENGNNGGPNRSSGSNGKNIIINVPIGTIIKNQNKEIIFEINQHDEKKTLFYGGKGGLGNWHFRSSRNQKPFFSQKGIKGKEDYIIIELKLLSDVGLVGYPNVGKSTLLSVLSNAVPKISNYPFTTIVPNLGVVRYHQFQPFLIADIPGIIKNASEGKGLGLQFLRHIERNLILLFILSGESLNHIDEYDVLITELKRYNSDLIHKKKIISISKCDVLSIENREKIKNKFNKEKIIFFSSHTKEGIKALKSTIYNLLEKIRK